MKRDLLEASYLHDDCLVIECDVTVIKEVRVVPRTPEIQVPPSDLSNNLAKLLEGKKGADVTIKVGGEVFYAHRIVLAMRSPVLDAELFGPMGDKEKRCMEIEDMQPAVFRALLHFIYTDALPAMDHLVGGDKTEMAKHLLVAADRYAMERMKLICESTLCKTLDTKAVFVWASTSAFRL
jgi:speckle-type POZ protein